MKPSAAEVAKQQRAIETRSQIINAAAQVFAASGYVSTSLNEIVRVADVTQGALYFHFGSKSELDSRLQSDLVQRATTAECHGF